MTLQQERGKFGEDYALNYLKTQGLILVVRNFTCRVGEIDLIMTDGEYLVFIEVRMRNMTTFAHALESITYTKQRKILKTATFYMQQNKYLGPCRIDAIGIDTENGQFKLDWVKNAISG
jgi:putative endonuclease